MSGAWCRHGKTYHCGCSRLRRRTELACGPDAGGVQAAALAVVGTTAFIALVDKVKLKRGERVLVRGAAGGVGAAAVQLIHAMGEYITVLASAEDADYVRSLGADEVLNYKRPG